MIEIFLQNIVPIIVAAGAGFVFQKTTNIDKSVLSNLALNCFNPCLVFVTLVSSKLPLSVLSEIIGAVLLNSLAMALLGFGIAILLNLSRTLTMTLIIILVFVNCGNFGLSFIRLRYGAEGLAMGVIYFTANTILLNTGGIFIASMGKLDWRSALISTLKFPAVYAAVLAILFYSFKIQLPDYLMKGFELVAEGAIPLMVIVLGMQVADFGKIIALKFTIIAVSLRLIIGPIVGFYTSWIIGLSDLGTAISIAQNSMPAAVFTIILATEFNLHPREVTSIVIMGTILSPLTISSAVMIFSI